MQFPSRRGRPKETIKDPHIKTLDNFFKKMKEVLKSDKEAREKFKRGYILSMSSEISEMISRNEWLYVVMEYFLQIKRIYDFGARYYPRVYRDRTGREMGKELRAKSEKGMDKDIEKILSEFATKIKKQLPQLSDATIKYFIRRIKEEAKWAASFL
jgi:hypothetical protein